MDISSDNVVLDGEFKPGMQVMLMTRPLHFTLAVVYHSPPPTALSRTITALSGILGQLCEEVLC